MKSRAMRRHHMKRIKERAKRYAIQRWIRGGKADWDQYILEKFLKNAEHLAKCSCAGCRPRKWEGDTVQEKLSDIDMNEQLKDL